MILGDHDAVLQVKKVTQAAGKADWRILEGQKFIELSGARCIVKTPTAVVRTELQKALGGYRRELPHSGDMEMWLRLAAHGSVGIVEAYQAVYREHDRNMSKRYCGESWLPDLEQRKLALDCFFETCSHTLTDAQQLRQRLLWSLACIAVGLASAAYDKGEIGLSLQLSTHALCACPQVTKSSSWKRLNFKRRIGNRAWRLLLPVVNGARLLEPLVKRTSKVFPGGDVL